MLHAGPDEALLPAARPVFADLSARGLAHRWAMHRRSSQAFALNLFAPLEAPGIKAVFALIGMSVAEVDAPTFEYSDPLDRLAEARPASPHRTQVDVLLRGTASDGSAPCIALVEVKFTEIDFGDCSAYENPANPHLDVCRTAGLFGGSPEHCFQLANHGDGRRCYDRYLANIPIVQPAGRRDDGGCLVRRGKNQPMRNLALAHLLLDEAEADRVAYVLCAPERHATIWRRFAEIRDMFPDTSRRTIRPLTAEQVAEIQPDEGAAFAQHYNALELGWRAG